MGNLFLPNLNADIINNGVVKGNVRYIFQTGALMLAITLVLGLVAIVAAYWASCSSFSTSQRRRPTAAPRRRPMRSPHRPLPPRRRLPGGFSSSTCRSGTIRTSR